MPWVSYRQKGPRHPAVTPREPGTLRMLSPTHTHSLVPPVPQPHAVHTEPAGPPLRTRTEEQESFEMRMNFGLAQGEQMKPKLTATEERRRRRSESSGGRAPGHEGLFGGPPTPFLKYLVLNYASSGSGASLRTPPPTPARHAGHPRSRHSVTCEPPGQARRSQRPGGLGSSCRGHVLSRPRPLTASRTRGFSDTDVCLCSH